MKGVEQEALSRIIASDRGATDRVKLLTPYSVSKVFVMVTGHSGSANQSEIPNPYTVYVTPRNAV